MHSICQHQETLKLQRRIFAPLDQRKSQLCLNQPTKRDAGNIMCGCQLQAAQHQCPQVCMDGGEKHHKWKARSSTGDVVILAQPACSTPKTHGNTQAICCCKKDLNCMCMHMPLKGKRAVLLAGQCLCQKIQRIQRAKKTKLAECLLGALVSEYPNLSMKTIVDIYSLY